MPREDPALEPGQDRLVEPDDPGEQLFAALELRQQVRAELVLDGAVRVSGVAELADRCVAASSRPGYRAPSETWRPAVDEDLSHFPARFDAWTLSRSSRD